jgi:LPS-assembly protein
VPALPTPVLTAAVVLALGSVNAVRAQPVADDGVVLRIERRLGDGRAPGQVEPTVFLRADRITGQMQERLELQGTAEVRRAGAVLRADRIVYTVATDELQLTGNVRVFGDGIVLRGPQAVLRLEAQTGAMPDAEFTYLPRAVSGTARLVELLGDGLARMRDATVTSCTPDDAAWWIRADRLTLDRGDELAVARGAALYFQGVPILASPYLQFPLGDGRRSGLLTPSFGLTSELGADVSVPYYWNIAPNRDATMTPRVMSSRGVLLQNEFRYLEPNHRGTIEYDIIPNDRKFDAGARDRLSIRHEYAGARGLSGGLNYNRVSDDRYFVDFGGNIVTASQSVLPQEAFLAYSRTYWNTSLRVTKNQTLQDPLAPVVEPYERVPQIGLNAQRSDLAGFDLGVGAELTRFAHPSLVQGTRVVVNPVASYPLLAPGYFVVPRLQWHATAYDLDPARRAGDLHPRRALPIASLDAGLVFDRPADWFGEPAVQTLEPRLFYAYVPLREQDRLPNFDSALADFNFTQLFQENVFVGNDRIGEANQLTLALVSRLQDPDTGAERLRAAFGQRRYYSPQRVTLPGGAPRTDRASDLLFALSGLAHRHWLADVSLQYSTEESRYVRASAGVRYQPRPASAVSLTYRYKFNELDQVDFAAQWPLTARMYGVGRLNYSLRDDRFVEVLSGLEYKASCWVLRLALHRFATAVQKTTTTFFIQLDLNGLGSVGPSPVQTLRRNIPGYQLINPPPREPGRYEYYE